MNTLDLRLLAVFDRIHTLRSVSKAAGALDMGQPAVSVALARLRQQFDDPLFVRTASGMEPTPLAQSLVGPIRAVLEAMEQVLGQRDSFDPANSQRTFRLCMTDISQLVLMPRLWEQLRQRAPGVRIAILPLSERTGAMLESGEADLALGYMPQLDSGFYQQLLFRQTFVCMVSSKHPRLRGRSLTRQQFEAEEHAVIRSSGSAPLIVEREIARQGIVRRIAVEIPSFLAAAFVAEHTELLLTIPSRLGDVLHGRGDFRLLPVPFELPSYAVRQHWHERVHNDRGHRWLRSLIWELLGEEPPLTPTPLP